MLFSIASCYFVFLLLNSQARPLNVDDMAQIHFTRKGLSIDQMWERYFTLQGDTYPPLLSILTALWLRVAPFGAGWLKLPSAFLVSMGIFLCGLCGLRQRSGFSGIVCALLAATSYTVFFECSLSFRAYGLLFFAEVLVLLCYVSRNHTLEIQGGRLDFKKYALRYSLAILLAAFTHYFAVLLCMLFFLGDFFLCLRKKMSWKMVLPYFIAGAVYSPWVLFGVLPAVGKYTNGFWPPPPTIETVRQLYIFCAGGSVPMSILTTVALISLAAALVKQFLTTRKLSLLDAGYLVLSFSAVALVALIYWYSTNFPSSIFAQRYFCVLLPLLLLLSASGLSVVAQALVDLLRQSTIKYVALAVLACFLVVINYSKMSPRQEAYWDASVWLREQPDINSENTLIMTTYVNEDGFNYFMTENWTLDAPTAVSADEYYVTTNLLDGINKIYVLEDFAGKIENFDAVLGGGFVRTEERADFHLEIYERN